MFSGQVVDFVFGSIMCTIDLKSPTGLFGVCFAQFDTDPTSAQLPGDDAGRSAAGKRVQDQISWMAAGLDNPVQDRFGHLTPVPAFPFFERTTHPWDVPGV